MLLIYILYAPLLHALLINFYPSNYDFEICCMVLAKPRTLFLTISFFTSPLFLCYYRLLVSSQRSRYHSNSCALITHASNRCVISHAWLQYEWRQNRLPEACARSRNFCIGARIACVGHCRSLAQIVGVPLSWIGQCQTPAKRSYAPAALCACLVCSRHISVFRCCPHSSHNWASEYRPILSLWRHRNWATRVYSTTRHWVRTTSLIAFRSPALITRLRIACVIHKPTDRPRWLRGTEAPGVTWPQKAVWPSRLRPTPSWLTSWP